MVREYNHEELKLDILSRLNTKSGGLEVIQEILDFFSSRLDVEAVGVRLFDGGDYPYLITKGFPENFVKSEHPLYLKDENGNIVYDENGAPRIECMCGSVIRGMFDSSLPYFTQHGSFWSNSTTDFLGGISAGEDKRKVLNVCSKCGYESVALIPIVVNGERLGLLQLNDPDRDKFDSSLIRILERVCDDIGVTLMRCKNEERIREEIRLKAVIEMAGSTCHEMNQPLQVLLGTCELISNGIVGTSGERFDEAMKSIQKSAMDIGRLTRKMQNITRYQSKSYPGSERIFDLNSSCSIS